MRANWHPWRLACAGLLVIGVHAAGAADLRQDMVRVPAGPFEMGADARDGRVGVEVGVDSVPRHRVDVDAFWIDRTEVPNLAYREFVRATGRRAPVDPRFPEYFSWEEGNFPSGLERHPVVYVDWGDANAYCEWAGKRLPTEAEWEKAARGTDGRRYPWGEEFDLERCNVREGKLGWTAPVGSFDGDLSPYGARDLCGNVSEWTADWYRAYPGSDLERRAFGEENKVIRGASWMLSYRPYARVTHRTLAFRPTKRHRAIGFRCAVSAADEAGR
ncbi:MAG: SUMF1/EgtB/PvdO family nonheme iron enzyme [Nitrospirae bacterium]|nr:SUMF1/EgtB/PvdO family nonheme iron enzyme [Nitrospirota bacterium]